MAEGFRLRISDSRLFPVQVFFNAIGDDQFHDVLGDLSRGVGRGFDEVVALFPGDVDPSEEPFEGVKFRHFEEEVVLDFPTFLQYLSQAADSYVNGHPEERLEVERLLTEARRRANAIL
jgi:hypothetical protein